MKKLLSAVLFVCAFAVAPAAPAVDITVPVVAAVSYAVGKGWIDVKAPVSAHLTDACQAKTLKAGDGPYVYTSFEHCLRS